MVLQSSGEISMNNLQVEFYATSNLQKGLGTSYTVAVIGNVGQGSGPYAMSTFYGKSNISSVTYEYINQAINNTNTGNPNSLIASTTGSVTTTVQYGHTWDLNTVQRFNTTWKVTGYANTYNNFFTQLTYSYTNRQPWTLLRDYDASFNFNPAIFSYSPFMPTTHLNWSFKRTA